MIADKVFVVLLGLVALFSLSTAAPDSAGIVEMVDGLAYGGIPYGSVTGMVAKYPGFRQGAGSSARGRQLNAYHSRPIVVTPNVRAKHLAGPRPVQIYNHPGVVAPGVVGSISEIGY